MSTKSGTPQKEQSARVHGGQSNRRTKDRGESKTVFKSVLANPFEVKWPNIPQENQNAILQSLVDILQGVAEYNLHRQRQTKPARKARWARKKAKALPVSKQPQQNAMDVDNTHSNPENESSASTSTTQAPAPEILQRLTIGINEVTKRLEQQCQFIPPAPIMNNGKCKMRGGNGDGVGGAMMSEGNTNSGITMGSAPGTTEPDPSASSASNTNLAIPHTPPIHTVVVCRADIDPPLLVAHIPYLVAAHNSSNRATLDPTSRIKLISLPKGAESKLAQVLALRRVSIIALDETVSRDDKFSTLLSSVETVVAPWLIGFGCVDSPLRSASTTRTQTPIQTKSKSRVSTAKRTQLLRRRLEPTHIKQLRTTAPKDMRAAKALRAKGRSQTKAERMAKEPSRKRKYDKPIKVVSRVGLVM